MASPQCEDGFTRIANELVGALMRTNFSSYQVRILWAILRKIYGWNKKADWISNSQLVEMTGIRKQHVSRTIRELRDRNIVTKSGYKSAFNKDYTQWRELPKQVTVTSTGNKVTNSGNKVTSLGEHKRHYTKDTLTKDIPLDILNLSDLLAQKILQNNPKHTRLSDGKYHETVERWAEDIEKLCRIDKQTVEDIRTVIEWSQKDSFWKINILSGAALREKWDRLRPSAIEEIGKSRKASETVPQSDVGDRIRAAKKEVEARGEI